MNEPSTFSLIDANILVYAFDGSDDFKHAVASELLESGLSGEKKLAISTQILSEFFHVAIRPSRRNNDLGLEQVRLLAEDIVRVPAFRKLVVSPAAVLEAFSLQQQSGVAFCDCLIAATMKSYGIVVIYTEDADFRKIKGITAINPFED